MTKQVSVSIWSDCLESCGRCESLVANKKWPPGETLKAVSCEKQLKELECPPLNAQGAGLHPPNLQRAKADIV